jgi:peptidoglycan hydrolase-like protein with peptidoglycan-binding domain
LALIDPKRHAKISKKARGLSDAGSANADVVLWQTLLGGDVAVDGIFGDQTESATIAWQQEHFRTDDGDIDEAAVDGVVGEQTWTRMLEIVSDAKVMELDRALLAVSRPIAESATRQLAKRIREEVRVPRPAGEPERSLDQMVTHGYEPSTPAGLEEDHDFSEMLKSAPSAVRNWLERWANGETNRGGRIPNAVVLFGAAIAANVGWVTWLSLVRRRRVAG